MKAYAECEGEHPEGAEARPLQHQAFSDVDIPGYVSKPERLDCSQPLLPHL